MTRAALPERPKVLYLSHAPGEVYDMIRAAAGARFDVLTLARNDDAERLTRLQEADAVIVASYHYTQPMIEASRRLTFVHHQGVGYQDTIDLDALRRTEARLAINPTGTTIGVAEHTVLLTLATLRRLAFADAELRQGRWHVNTLRFESRELFGRTVGYVGMGRIGQAAAERFCAFGTRGLYTDPHVRLPEDRERALGVERVDLPTLLGASDIVSLHVPSTPETHHLIDGDALALMKPRATLVNTARGDLVDETALLEALESGRLGGAGLDVFAEEPFATVNPLARLRNVVLTPHISAGTRDAFETKMAALFENLARFYAGDEVENEIAFRDSGCAA
jgi:phosphoglycerate dehydrogenase-like enzyme